MSSTPPRTKVWRFDEFAVGADLGTVEVPLDQRRLALWRGIYGESGNQGDGHVAMGMLVAAMMEGYIRAIQPRPPGNVHVGQTLSFTGHRVAEGATLALTYFCLAKALLRDRRWITFGVRAFDGDMLAMSGEIQSIWAL